METEKDEEKASMCQQLPLREFKTDEGWAWVILASVTVGMFLNHLAMMSFGVLYAPLFERFELSAMHIAWINGLSMFSWNVIVIFIGPCCEVFGWRAMAMFGTGLNAAGVLLSAYVPYSTLLFLYISGLAAVGTSTYMTVSIFVVSNYFKKRRGMALAVTSMGVCGAILAGPPLTLFLNKNCGPQWSFISMGMIVVIGIPLSYLYHPTEWHTTIVQPEPPCEKSMTEERQPLTIVASHATEVIDKIRTRKMSKIASNSNEQSTLSPGRKVYMAMQITLTNFRYLKQRRVLHICFASPFALLGYITFQIWIPFVIVNRGFTLETASLCMSASGAANFVGRLFLAMFSDYSCFKPLFMYKMSILTNALSILCFGYCTSLWGLVPLVSIWGFSSGTMMVLYPITMIEVMGIDKLPVVFGIARLMTAFMLLSINPIVGFVKDQTGNFEAPLAMLAALILVSLLLWLTMPSAKEDDKQEETDKISVAAA